MKVKKLDHIALYMSDRDAAARFLTTHLGFHVVDHTERYTLVGAGGRLGKLTLFDAPQGTTPSPGEIERITIRVADPEAAARELPAEAGAEPPDGGYSFTGPEGLPLALVPGEGEFADYDLEGFTLRSGSPEESARTFVEMGFAPGDEATTVRAGDYLIRLTDSAPDENGGGMLFHVGCLVDSAEDHRREAEERGLEVTELRRGPEYPRCLRPRSRGRQRRVRRAQAYVLPDLEDPPVRVVVAGGGLAGLTAALRAAELGAQVTLLEKGDRPGGSFVYSSGYVWSYVDMPTFRREAPGGDACLQRLILDRLGSWPELAGGRGRRAPLARDWEPPHVRRPLRPRTDGRGAGGAHWASGGEILTDTAFEALREDAAGRVTGVLAPVPGSEQEYACRCRDPCVRWLRGEPGSGRAPHNRGAWKDAGAGAPEEYGRRFSRGAARRARSRAPASTSSTAGTCPLPRPSFLPNGLWKSPSSTAATPWRSTPAANATPTRARTGPRRP